MKFIINLMVLVALMAGSTLHAMYDEPEVEASNLIAVTLSLRPGIKKEKLWYADNRRQDRDY